MSFKNLMFNSINTKDLIFSGLIIFTMSTIIAKLYIPLWGFIYALGNVLTLIFLSWLYKDSWNSNQ